MVRNEWQKNENLRPEAVEKVDIEVRAIRIVAGLSPEIKAVARNEILLLPDNPPTEQGRDLHRAWLHALRLMEQKLSLQTDAARAGRGRQLGEEVLALTKYMLALARRPNSYADFVIDACTRFTDAMIDAMRREQNALDTAPAQAAALEEVPCEQASQMRGATPPSSHGSNDRTTAKVKEIPRYASATGDLERALREVLMAFGTGDHPTAGAIQHCVALYSTPPLESRFVEEAIGILLEEDFIRHKYPRYALQLSGQQELNRWRAHIGKPPVYWAQSPYPTQRISIVGHYGSRSGG